MGPPTSDYSLINCLLTLSLVYRCICQDWTSSRHHQSRTAAFIIHCNWWQGCNCYDHDIFCLVWHPTYVSLLLSSYLIFFLAGPSDLMEFLGLLRPKSSQELYVTFLEHGRHSANGMKPTKYSKTTVTLTLICRLTQFVITKALPYIFASLGYGTWFFFASWMLLATIWAFFFLPETKGKTLDEIDVILWVEPMIT